MLNDKITTVERSIKELKELKEKTDRLINERKMKFAMIGVNEIIKTLAELMILENILDSLSELIEVDSEGVDIVTIQGMKNNIPGAGEMLGYLSLEYRDVLSDECQVIKKFIDEFRFQEVTQKLFG